MEKLLTFFDNVQKMRSMQKTSGLDFNGIEAMQNLENLVDDFLASNVTYEKTVKKKAAVLRGYYDKS